MTDMTNLTGGDSIITEQDEDGEWEVAIPDDEAGQQAALDVLVEAMANHVQEGVAVDAAGDNDEVNPKAKPVAE